MLLQYILKRKMAQSYKNLSEGDIEGFVKNWTEDATFTYPGDIAESGIYRGKNEITTFFEHLIEQFPKRHFKVKHICFEKPPIMAFRNTVIVEWDVELTNKHGDDYLNHGVSVIEMQGVKAVKVKDYFFDTSIMPEIWRK